MNLNKLYIYISLMTLATVTNCGNNDPKKEDVPELITKVTLTFTPTTGTPIVVTATDPDGEGVQNIKTDGSIALSRSTTYVLSIQLVNGLAQPGDDGYDVTHEVQNEGVEHQFFFSWDGDAFSNPEGNGNIDHRDDPVNYDGGDFSKDKSGLPLGLQTTWASAGISTTGVTFRVLLKHQPGLKSQVSTSSDGETDLDLSFPLTVN
jgi:hypothetical protein